MIEDQFPDEQADCRNNRPTNSLPVEPSSSSDPGSKKAPAESRGRSPFGISGDADKRRLNLGGAATDLASCPEEGVSKLSPFGGIVLSWGAATSIGQRTTLEDTHFGVPELSQTNQKPKSSLFGVFDGHGGVEAAEYARDHLPNLVSGHATFSTQPGLALNTAFLELDEKFYESVKDESPPHGSGSTLLAALLVGNDLWLANAGDSRAVISCRGKAEDLTEDHRPNCESEAARVRARGGYISEDGYLCGQLGVTRGIGDYHAHSLKHKIDNQSHFTGPLTAEPTISMRTLKSEDEFIIMACDGLWDLWPSQRVIEIARQNLQHNNNDPIICAQHLIKQSEARHASDNVTVIVICLSESAPPRREVTDLKRSVSQNGIASLRNALQRAMDL